MAMKKNTRSKAEQREPTDYGKVLGSNLNFGASEAYRLLRTNLDFSLPDATGCKVIGVTSTLRGEGKSTTSLNLSYTMAQTDQRVLLLECDLRLPTASKRLQVKDAPGLSNLLSGKIQIQDAIQVCDLSPGLRVITAGDIPPNPAELLNSKQMQDTIDKLKEQFDVIIVDLPPVGVVSDALITSRLLNGMIIVVREGMCSRSELNDTVRRLKFSGCNILGFVMTNVGFRGRKYGYGYYKKYGYGYYRRRHRKQDPYGYESYANSHPTPEKSDK